MFLRPARCHPAGFVDARTGVVVTVRGSQAGGGGPGSVRERRRRRFVNIRHRGGQPSAETCAAQWKELSPSKQASLDRAGFDAGCYGDSIPETVTFGADSSPSPSGTP